MEVKDSEESSDGRSEVDEMNNHGMGGRVIMIFICIKR
jgi:hypothetical protein